MLVLVHFRKAEINKLLDSLTRVKHAYTSNSYGSDVNLMALLEQAEAFFKQIGENSMESRVGTLRSYLHTAREGINPENMEIVRTFRRKVVKSACFYCISELSSLLEKEGEKIGEILKRTSTMISQILLTALQSHALTMAQLEALDSIEKISIFWAQIKESNDQIKVIDKQLKLDILDQDIYLLIDEIIEKFKS
jgi:hypothetical protein